MIHKSYLVVMIIFSLICTGCSSSKKATDNSLNAIYTVAQKNLQYGEWKKAIIQLELLDNCYSIGPYLQQVQLDLIYAYYKNNDILSAQTTIDRFMYFNPTHRNIDYVIYMRGLTNMSLDENALQIFFGVDRSGCDPQHARNAFNDFSKLVHNYPNSYYVNDATKRLVFLKNRLAKYEYLVADYYARRGAWIAVINRIEGMLHNYQDTQIIHNALVLMEHAYRQMQMKSQADKVARIIATNNYSY